MRLFVYGTLMSGFGNNRLLTGASLLNEEYKLNAFKMKSFGFFPVITPDNASSVLGEMWDINDNHLERCDRLEGHPNFYTRIKLEDDDGMFYTYMQPISKLTQLPDVTSGNWRQHRYG